MRLIFLDIDGVLNSLASFGVTSKRGYRKAKGTAKARAKENYSVLIDDIDKEAVSRLNRIIERTGAKVIISSSRRKDYSYQEIEKHLQAAGFTGEVIGSTPVFIGEDVRRGDEIGYVASKLKPERFVILDDGNDMRHLKDRLVLTDTATGLLDEHVERAVALLT